MRIPIVVEVEGGVATVLHLPSQPEPLILDWDNVREMTDADEVGRLIEQIDTLLGMIPDDIGMAIELEDRAYQLRCIRTDLEDA